MCFKGVVRGSTSQSFEVNRSAICLLQMLPFDRSEAPLESRPAGRLYLSYVRLWSKFNIDS